MKTPVFNHTFNSPKIKDDNRSSEQIFTEKADSSPAVSLVSCIIGARDEGPQGVMGRRKARERDDVCPLSSFPFPLALPCNERQLKRETTGDESAETVCWVLLSLAICSLFLLPQVGLCGSRCKTKTHPR